VERSRPLTRDLPFSLADRRHVLGRIANLSTPIFTLEVSHRPTLVIPTGAPKGAQWRDLQFSGPFLEMCFAQARRMRTGQAQ
jgi:hypothetical protein